jgi:hypothetical protein
MTPSNRLPVPPSGGDTAATDEALDLGEERARWARLPYEERMQELAWHHAHFNTPDDLSVWPAELDGGVDRP